ncbi:MAG: LysR family transcriptional regulator [Eubacterium sp.]|nr:LysR family transcriptional regulator [Eubacterium sp.]
MTTQQIRFFLEVANCLNFSEAARHLFVSQPALSKQIALLEDELDVKLFTRTKRVVALTPAGTMLYKELDNIEKSLLNVIEKARYIDQGTDGRLSVGILELADPSTFATPLFIKFQKAFPRIDLNISFLGFSEIREALKNGSIDIAFSKDFDTCSMNGLRGIDIKSNAPAILLPKNHPMASQSSIKVSELKNESFVALSSAESRASAHTLIDLCGKEGFSPKISKYADSHLDRIYYVTLGYGISVVDLDIALPPWANLTAIPVYSSSPDEFSGIDLRMIWLDSCANPSLHFFTDMATEIFAS